MTTAVQPETEEPEPISAGQLIEALAAAAAANPDQPEPIGAGTFVIYPMPNGGLMAVLLIADGPMKGEQRISVPPGLLRTAVTLLGGGNPISRGIKAIRGKKKAKDAQPG